MVERLHKKVCSPKEVDWDKLHEEKTRACSTKAGTKPMSIRQVRRQQKKDENEDFYAIHNYTQSKTITTRPY